MKMSTDYTDIECSENNVEEEDSWRTVNCLRGRLLAERMASRNAREEADQLGTRLLEVEKLLEEEGKSRKKAEKKLKWLRRKLECINMISDEESESQHAELNDDKVTDRLVLVSSSASSACCGDRDPMSMALVPVEMPSPEKESSNNAVDVDPEILDATVRQVLESLRRAKEQLQNSMDQRRRMSSNMIIKVG